MEKNNRPPWETLLHAGHTHIPRRGMSRREVLGAAGAAGAVRISGFPGKALAAKPGSGIPNPLTRLSS